MYGSCILLYSCRFVLIFIYNYLTLTDIYFLYNNKNINIIIYKTAKNIEDGVVEYGRVKAIGGGIVALVFL